MGIAPSTLSNKLRQDVDSLMDFCEAIEIDTGELGQILKNGERAFKNIEKLEKIGFEKIDYNYGRCWIKILKGNQLEDFFNNSPKHLELFLKKEITHLYIEIYPFKKTVTYIEFEHFPTHTDIVSCSNYAEVTDYEKVIQWISK